MSRARTEINESLSSILVFLRMFKTLEIGEMACICQQLEQQPSLFEQKILSRILIQFIMQVHEEAKKDHIDKEYQALIILESIVYNLYSINNKNKMNSSIYSNSLMVSSSSHIGGDTIGHSFRQQEGDDNLNSSLVTFLKDFMTDGDFYKKMKQIFERGARKAADGPNQNQRYIQLLLDTIEYILNKENKFDSDTKAMLEQYKDIIASKTASISNHFLRKDLQNIIKEVNKVIFSSKLHRISFMLEQAPDAVYLSLLRVYFYEQTREDNDRKKVSKYFSEIEFNGEQMMTSLVWAYVDSIKNSNNLFQPSKNPLFRLVESYLVCFYMPVFRKFNQLVIDFAKRFNFLTNLDFYEVCEASITKNLYEFIEFLPSDLVEFLRQIYRIIIVVESKINKKQISSAVIASSLASIKKLFIYSLLGRPLLIESYYSQGVDLQKHEQICNYLISLFFKSSLKAYQHLQPAQIHKVSSLTNLISNKFDLLITSNQKSEQAEYMEQFERAFSVRSYMIMEPIVTHDYQTLWQHLRQIEFTPKDLKQFEMHKKADINSYFESPSSLPPISSKSLSMTGPITPNVNVISPREGITSILHKNRNSPDVDESVENFHTEDEEGIGNGEDIDFYTWMTLGGSRDYEKPPQSAKEQKVVKAKKKMQTLSRDKVRQVSRLYYQYQKIIL